MQIINAGYKILTTISEGGIEELQHIEKIGRVCYKSEDKITSDGKSAKKFVKMIIDKGHEAMIEHSSLSVKFIVDRGVSHELVRHRIMSFAQESTRYCNYCEDKFNNEVTFIKPFFFDGINYQRWLTAMVNAESTYFALLNSGATPQEARSVLPNSTKTEIIITTNYREWRHFFKLRTSNTAHPQMREVTIPLLAELKEKLPIIFDDIEVERKENERKASIKGAYISGNKDDLTSAVHGLDIFTKNWCMNCTETDRTNDLVFNCQKCEFSTNDVCLVKKFANKHKHDYHMSDFGSMGQL